MPFVENQGAKIYWDEQGSGEPLLLIMGLSYPSYMWHRTRPVLANVIAPSLSIIAASAKAMYLQAFIPSR